MGSKPTKGAKVQERSQTNTVLDNGKLVEGEKVEDDPDEAELSDDEQGDAPTKSTKIGRNMAFKDIRERVEASMDFLSPSSDFSDKAILANLFIISRTYYALKIKRRRNDLIEVCNLLLEKGIMRLFTTMWDFFHQNRDELYGNVKGIKFRTLKKMKVIFMSYSNKCPELARACYNDGEVIGRLMTELTFPELGVGSLRSLQRRNVVKTNFAILINVVRHCNSNKEHIRKNEGIDRLLNHASSSFLIIKAEAYIILAYCINEDENDKITTGEGVIKFIINILCSALSSANHVAVIYGFSAEETVAALNRLASSDENKKNIVEAGVLSELSKILREDAKVNEDEQYEAVNCVWTLAFHPENRERIIGEPGLVKSVKRIQQSSEDSGGERLNKACTSVLFVLGLEDIHTDGEKSGTSTKHIMISYNWEVQDVVLKLRDFLKENGYNVWIDVEKMQDSILSAMADAVENASIVLVAMTESYKNSNPCRTEAEYAYKRSVPVLPLLLQQGYIADGWLGAMVGTKLYVDLSSQVPNQKFDEVEQQIIRNIASPNMSVKIAKDRTSMPAVVSQPIETKRAPVEIYGRSVLQTDMPCSNWTNEDVREWFKTLKIEDRQALPTLDGNSLSQLCKMLVRSPDNYYRVIREDLRFSVQDMLTFTGAIESLILG